ncbi:MAG: serine/threonine-protein phosphatase [bacterium]|nr:serine/threonine-protein phosphatase [bacterium]
MSLRYAACTDVGRRRRVNEDAFAIRADRGLFVVADGLGGHVAGRRASSTATAAFVSSLLLADGISRPDAMRYGALCANAALHDAAEREPDLRGMATTLVAIWVVENQLTLAHVGDSRIYLLRSGSLRPLTLDHSVVGELEAQGQLSPEQVATHPQRHVITRALGVRLRVEPDIASMRVQCGDVVLLCSDGINGQLTDEDICDTLVSRADDLDAAARSLISEANARGGSDNATAVLVGIK